MRPSLYPTKRQSHASQFACTFVHEWLTSAALSFLRLWLKRNWLSFHVRRPWNFTTQSLRAEKNLQILASSVKLNRGMTCSSSSSSSVSVSGKLSVATKPVPTVQSLNLKESKHKSCVSVASVFLFSLPSLSLPPLTSWSRAFTGLGILRWLRRPFNCISILGSRSGQRTMISPRDPIWESSGEVYSPVANFMVLPLHQLSSLVRWPTSKQHRSQWQRWQTSRNRSLSFIFLLDSAYLWWSLYWCWLRSETFLVSSVIARQAVNGRLWDKASACDHDNISSSSSSETNDASSCQVLSALDPFKSLTQNQAFATTWTLRVRFIWLVLRLLKTMDPSAPKHESTAFTVLTANRFCWGPHCGKPHVTCLVIFLTAWHSTINLHRWSTIRSYRCLVSSVIARQAVNGRLWDKASACDHDNTSSSSSSETNDASSCQILSALDPFKSLTQKQAFATTWTLRVRSIWLVLRLLKTMDPSAPKHESTAFTVLTANRFCWGPHCGKPHVTCLVIFLTAWHSTINLHRWSTIRS